MVLSLILFAVLLAGGATAFVLCRRRSLRPAAGPDGEELSRLEGHVQRLRQEVAWLTAFGRRAAADLSPHDARRLVQELVRDLLPGGSVRLAAAPELLDGGLDPDWGPGRDAEDLAQDLAAVRAAGEPLVVEEESWEAPGRGLGGEGSPPERRRALFPLACRGHVLGVLSVRYPVHAPFPDDVRQTLEVVASGLGTVLAALCVEEQAFRQSRAFDEITSVTNTIGETFSTVESLTLDHELDATIGIIAEVAGVVPAAQRTVEAWQRIVEAARAVVRADGAALFLTGGTDDAPGRPLTTGWRPERELRLHLAASRSRLQRQEEPGPLLVRDTAAGSTVDRYLARAGLRSLAAVPVRAQGALAGVLYVCFRAPRELSSMEQSLLQVLASLASLSIQTDRLLDGQRSLVNQTLGALGNLLHAADPSLAQAGERTAALAVRIGRELGLDPRDLTLLWLAARYRDVGRIAAAVRRQADTAHPDASVEVLAPLAFLNDALPAVLHHHERFDGTGYPHRVGGRRIPLAARILAAAEVVDRGLAAGRSLADGLAAAVTALRAATDEGALDPNVTAAAFRALRRGRPAGPPSAAGSAPQAAAPGRRAAA